MLATPPRAPRHGIPGFRTGRPWKKALALVLYIAIGLFTLAAIAASTPSIALFGALILALFLIAANGWGLRSRIPLVRSSNPLAAAGGWVLLILCSFVLLVIAIASQSKPSTQAAAPVTLPLTAATATANPTANIDATVQALAQVAVQATLEARFAAQVPDPTTPPTTPPTTIPPTAVPVAAPPTSVPPRPTTNPDPNYAAITACERFISPRLKAPASAKYSGWFDTVTQTNPSNRTTQVFAYVDSQNAFGAMLRTHYVCTIMPVGSEWKLISLTGLD